MLKSLPGWVVVVVAALAVPIGVFLVTLKARSFAKRRMRFWVHCGFKRATHTNVAFYFFNFFSTVVFFSSRARTLGRMRDNSFPACAVFFFFF